MTHHASGHPARVPPKPREKGSAHAVVHHERRHRSMEGRYGVIGAGATLTGATVQTTDIGGDPTNYYPGIVFDDTGLGAYNSGGTQTMFINAADGSITVTGAGTITGATIQTSASNPRTVMNSSGIQSYDNLGNQTFNLGGGQLTVGGQATITGATVQTTSGSTAKVIMDASGIRAINSTGTTTVNLQTTGAFTLTTANASITASTSGVTISSAASVATGARVVIDPTGIRGFNAGGTQQFLLDAASGLITATGVITANAGSTLPWQTTGFFVGGGNLLANASGEDPTSNVQVLFIDTGSTATAGTFTLKYGSNPATASLSWNSTASQVQTALNAAGVLPAGVTVTCTGGPLPGTPVSITFSTTAGTTPSVITVATNSITGGSAVVGVDPAAWSQYQTDAVIVNTSTGAAWHGGNVLQGLVNHGTSGGWFTSQNIGPYTFVPGTSYTLSAYYKAPSLALNAILEMEWRDSDNTRIIAPSTTSSWTTNAQTWQRHILTSQVPPVNTRQKITISGSPTAGNFTLTYKGQTTAAIAWNATSGQIQTALQALSNIGSGGVPNVAGGPLPGTPVSVSLYGASVSAPSQMTATSSLTGGTPTISISSLNTTYLIIYLGTAGAPTNAASYVYVDGLQLEVADVPTAFAPRPDEILADTVQANMINVAQLSAITADLGTINAGTVNGVTLNGGVVQTAASGSRVSMEGASNSISIYDSSGTNQIITMNPVSGLSLTQGTSGWNAVSWHSGNVAGTQIADVFATTTGALTDIQMEAHNLTTSTAVSAVLVQTSNSVDTDNFAQFIVHNASGSVTNFLTLSGDGTVGLPGASGNTLKVGRVTTYGYIDTVFDNAFHCGNWYRSGAGSGWYDQVNSVGVYYNANFGASVVGYNGSWIVSASTGSKAGDWQIMGYFGAVGAYAGTGSTNGSSSVSIQDTAGDIGGFGSTNAYPVINSSMSNLFFTIGGAYAADIASNGVYTSHSGVALKSRFEELDGEDMLNRIAKLDVRRFEFNNYAEGVKRIGPTAEKFFELFRLGTFRPDPLPKDQPSHSAMIAIQDLAGVALAGVQGLIDKVKHLELQVMDLEHRLFLEEVRS